MAEPTNEDRAARGYKALKAYWESSETDTPQSTLGDLLADLMHHFGATEFDAVLETARSHYAAECEEV